MSFLQKLKTKSTWHFFSSGVLSVFTLTILVSAAPVTGLVTESNDQSVTNEIRDVRPPKITVHPADLRVQYGKYAEAEVVLEGVAPEEKIKWSIASETAPEGLELEITEKSNVLIFGTPYFTGSWCFILSAKVLSTGTDTFEEVCYQSDENDDFKYPRFLTERLLPIAYTHQFYQEMIHIDSNSMDLFKGELVQGSLPSGFTMAAEASDFKFIVRGRATQEENRTFVIRAEDSDGSINYHQFLLVAQDS